MCVIVSLQADVKHLALFRDLDILQIIAGTLRHNVRRVFREVCVLIEHNPREYFSEWAPFKLVLEVTSQLEGPVPCRVGESCLS